LERLKIISAGFCGGDQARAPTSGSGDRALLFLQTSVSQVGFNETAKHWLFGGWRDQLPWTERSPHLIF
jgi:hypothetical protein